MRLPSSALALVLLAAPAAAQRLGSVELSIGASRAVIDHALMDRGTGPAVRATVPLGGTGFGLRLGVERLTGRQHRVDITCVGGPIPENSPCFEERAQRDDGVLRLAHAGLSYRLLDRGGIALDVLGDARVGRVDVATHIGPGTTGEGDVRRAGKSLWGVEWGGEAAWTPSRRVPLSLVGGAAMGHLDPRASSGMVDGHAPFEGALSVRRAYLGLGWRPAAR